MEHLKMKVLHLAAESQYEDVSFSTSLEETAVPLRLDVCWSWLRLLGYQYHMSGQIYLLYCT